MDYVKLIKNFLNPEGHQNPINGSKVTAILLQGRILPIGGASAVEGLRSTGLPCLVYHVILEGETEGRLKGRLYRSAHLSVVVVVCCRGHSLCPSVPRSVAPSLRRSVAPRMIDD